MLSIYCPKHGSEVLVGTRQIRGFTNTEHGIAVEVECYCGHRVTGGTGRHYSRRGGLALAS